jgi:long-chain acyl-CoA synthetase
VIGFLAHASVYRCFSPKDRFLVTTPLFHGGGFAFPMGTLFLGGTVDLMPPFAPDLLAAELATGRATGTFVVPTQLNALLGLGLNEIRGHRLRAAICNAAPLAEETKLRTLDLLGEGILHETYGSTEGGVITNLAPADMRLKAHCVGPPIAGQSVRLLDDAGNQVARGEVGELFSNGPTLFNGYFNKPDETAAGFRDGWFSAGDLAQMDEDGYYYIVDRRKDMILSGGVNIYPREIEEVLYGLDGIREAAVVGQPDAHWGEAVCAFVVPEPGAVLDGAAVIGRCRAELAGHKVPKAVHIIDAIPRNAAGKVLKKDLRARLE